MARSPTRLASGAARPPGPALLLGALVSRLQSRSAGARLPKEHLRTERPGPDRSHQVVWIRRRRQWAAPATQKQYIDQVRRRYYQPWPICRYRRRRQFPDLRRQHYSHADPHRRAGVVRFYHPGAASERELSGRIQAISEAVTRGRTARGEGPSAGRGTISTPPTTESGRQWSSGARKDSAILSEHLGGRTVGRI